MRRLVYMLALAVVFAVPGFFYAWNGNAWSSGAVTGPATIRITSREISRVRVDVGRPRPRSR